MVPAGCTQNTTAILELSYVTIDQVKVMGTSYDTVVLSEGTESFVQYKIILIFVIVISSPNAQADLESKRGFEKVPF